MKLQLNYRKISKLRMKYRELHTIPSIIYIKSRRTLSNTEGSSFHTLVTKSKLKFITTSKMLTYKRQASLYQ